jgi:hypothetical protein
MAQTIAKKIINISNYTEALIRANEYKNSTEENYKEETTIFTFEDESRIKFDGISMDHKEMRRKRKRI